MRDYSIEEAIEIINSCDQSFMPVLNILMLGIFNGLEILT